MRLPSQSDDSDSDDNEDDSPKASSPKTADETEGADKARREESGVVEAEPDPKGEADLKMTAAAGDAAADDAAAGDA